MGAVATRNLYETSAIVQAKTINAKPARNSENPKNLGSLDNTEVKHKEPRQGSTTTYNSLSVTFQRD
jgi:hypothetical protein